MKLTQHPVAAYTDAIDDLSQYSTVDMPSIAIATALGLMRVISTSSPAVQHSVSPIFQSSSAFLSKAPQQFSSAALLLPGPDCRKTISSQLFPPLPPDTSPSHITESNQSTPWWNESVFPSFNVHTEYTPQVPPDIGFYSLASRCLFDLNMITEAKLLV